MIRIGNAKEIKDSAFLEKLVNERKHKVLDVRGPEDYRYGTLLEAPNAPLRSFLVHFSKALKESNKIVLIGTERDTDTLNACIRYAEQSGGKYLNLSYFLYENK